MKDFTKANFRDSTYTCKHVMHVHLSEVEIFVTLCFSQNEPTVDELFTTADVGSDGDSLLCSSYFLSSFSPLRAKEKMQLRSLLDKTSVPTLRKLRQRVK